MSGTTKGSGTVGPTSKEIFNKAKPALQQLVKAILTDEREVMHMETRPRIHENILERIKKAVS